MRNSYLVFFLIILFWASSAQAFTADKKLPDAAMEARAQELFRNIKCMVCEGQPIHDSNAELAKDMRFVIRGEIQKGLTDAQILEFMRERYGEAVLLSPPLNLSTVLLWFFPLILLVFGGFKIRKHVQLKHK